MRVVPEGACVLGTEAVHELVAWEDSVLRHTRHAILAVRHIDAVPVDRRALRDVAVAQHDAHEVALLRLDHRPRGVPVDREDTYTASGDLVSLEGRGERVRDVRWSIRSAELGHASYGSAVVLAAAAVVHHPHVVNGVGVTEQAVLALLSLRIVADIAARTGGHRRYLCDHDGGDGGERQCAHRHRTPCWSAHIARRR